MTVSFGYEEIAKAREEGFALGFYAYHSHITRLFPFMEKDVKGIPELKKVFKLLDILGSMADENLDTCLARAEEPD